MPQVFSVWIKPIGGLHVPEGVFERHGILLVADLVQGIAAGLGDAGLEIDAGEFEDRGVGVEHGDGIGGDDAGEGRQGGLFGGGAGLVVGGAEEEVFFGGRLLEDEPLVGAVGGDHRHGVDVAGDVAPELGGPGAGVAVAGLHHAGVGDEVEVV
jgi:hypothetical protein